MLRAGPGAICSAAALVVALPLAAQTEIDLSAFSVDHLLDGAAGDKLGGFYLNDSYATYWDTPTDGDQDTGHGPASVRGAVSCDFDGDGFLDLAIGAPARSASAGGVYLFYGRPDQMLGATIALSTATNYDVVYTGDANSDFGNQVVAGDVNGDGFCDLLVNAPERSNNQGAVYLLLGGARAAGTLFPPGPGATVNAGANYSIRTSDNESFDVVSYSVAIGDVSGDGVADFIVGALFDDSAVNRRDTGSVAVFFGKTTVTRANTSGLSIDLDTASSGGASITGYNVRYWGATGFGILSYEGPADNLGAAVAAIDLDGDAVQDVVMGAPSPQLDYSTTGTNDTGSVYVVLGGGAPSGTGTVNLGSGSISLANAGAYHLRFNNVQNWAHFGAAIAGGDLIGDAAEDLLVAAPYGWFNFSAGNESGSVYLIAGSTTWQGMSRNNTQIDLVGPGNGYTYRFDGAAADDELRAVAVADMDHDGNADLLLGAPHAAPSGRSEAGAAYYFAGPWSGSGTVDLGAATPPYDERISGAAAGDRAGLMVAAVDYPCGTVRRVVAAPYSSGSAGKVYVMPPLNPPLATTLRLATGNDQVGAPGQLLTDPIEVEVVDASGRLIGCTEVGFVAGSGGSVGASTVYTGVNGLAKTTWQLGPGAGNQTATATVGGLAGSPVTFSACAAIGATDDTCDNIDDDCSGTADEDFVAQPTSCGAGACTRTGTRTCVSGSPQDSCMPGTPAASDATCDNVDDDCSGAADEDFIPQPTTCGLGACASSGTSSCVNGNPQDSCVPGTPAADDATCDSIDDDCSGAADEDYVAQQTQCGVGACERTGSTTCVNGTVTTTQCQPGDPIGTDDTCDGVDDDCDGASDEDAVAGAACDDGSGDGCRIGVCSPQTHLCETSRRSNCCLSSDAECAAPGRCLVGHCDTVAQRCGFEAIAGCCLADADCDDGDGCTSERCDAASASCVSQRSFGCCSSNADCDDGDPCSYDQCTQVNRCLYSPGACVTSGPCGGDQACLYSGVLIGRGDHTPVGVTVRDGATQPVLQLVVTTAALGGNLASLRLRLDGLTGVVASPGALTAHLYDDPDDDGLIAPEQTPIATARTLELASGAIVLEEMTAPLAPASSRHLLLALRRTGAAGGCSAVAGHAIGPGWFGLLALIGLRRRSRRRMLTLLLAAAIGLAAVGACARTGYVEVHQASISIEQDADVVVIGGANEKLVVQGAPLSGAPFQVMF